MKIKIDNENELYNPFDKFEETLSEDLISYINNKTEISSIKEKEDIKVITSKKIDENKFKKLWAIKLKNSEIKFETLAKKEN